MDAALPRWCGGLVPGLVIAVPTSVGYGVAAGGHVALNAMLASCAPGIAVVNIDNGYGAACAALPRRMPPQGRQERYMERRDFMKASAGRHRRRAAGGAQAGAANAAGATADPPATSTKAA